MLNELVNDIEAIKNPERAAIMQRFFRTGKDQYGEGDIFYGLSVPQQRELAKKYKNLPLPDIKRLLTSPTHEKRLIAVFILVTQYQNGNDITKQHIYNFYLHSRAYVNNWDIVDSSADKILGAHLLNAKKEILYDLAHSHNLWERRMAIIATYFFIKQNEFDDTLKIAEILLQDNHDLIHKAVGWMLREVGKRNKAKLEAFLNKHATAMPRTMLRYAIEKFPEDERQIYLRAKQISVSGQHSRV